MKGGSRAQAESWSSGWGDTKGGSGAPAESWASGWGDTRGGSGAQAESWVSGSASAGGSHEAPSATVTTGQGAVYTALASGLIDEIVYNRSSSFEIKQDVLKRKDGETEDDRLFRIAHVLYMRMTRSFKSHLAVSDLV